MEVKSKQLNEINFKMSSAKWPPFSLGLNGLRPPQTMGEFLFQRKMKRCVTTAVAFLGQVNWSLQFKVHRKLKNALDLH